MCGVSTWQGAGGALPSAALKRFVLKENLDKWGCKTTETLSGISVTSASMPMDPQVHLNLNVTSSLGSY